MLLDKPSELCQCEPKSPESNAGSYANSFPFAVFNLCFRFTLDLHKIRFSPSPIVRRRVVYELLKHAMSMTCPKPGTPGPAHSSTWLSKDSHAAPHAGLGAAEPRSPHALLDPSWPCTETTQRATTTLLQPEALERDLWVLQPKCFYTPRFSTSLEHGPGPVPAFASSDK